MLKVNSCQFNYQYGNQIHFPYSIACLVSYLKEFDWIKENCKFEKTFVFRDKFEEYIEQCYDTDILLCSCYVWNWEITSQFAKRVKEINGNCLIISGGPQIPNEPTKEFFMKNEFDIYVHNEGELILKNIFEKIILDKSHPSIGKKIENIKGISTLFTQNSKEDRISDLSILPSPYLTNEVWNLVDKSDDIRWVSSWETNRGCPYQCTFCDWGSATYTKLRKYPTERLLQEIEWFSNNEIDYIDCCDANFGILHRDLELAKKMKEQALENGFPKTFRQSWAKMSSNKIIPIAQELKDGNLLSAVGLAVESLDENTLDVIKRKNIKFDVFSDLTKEFKKNNLPTYTEIIRALPGETLQSFKSNLEELVSNSEIGSIYIYNCCVLPNAPLNDSDYKNIHGVQTIKSPIYLAHSSIHNRGIQEYEEIVSQTATATNEDVKKMFLYSWLILTFQNLGLFEYISRYFNQEFNLSFMEFYDLFLEYCSITDGLFSKEYNIVKDYIDNGYSGLGWDHYDFNLGPIFWPIEEASWLRLTNSVYDFLNDLKNFTNFLSNKKKYSIDNFLIYELCKFQTFTLTSKFYKNYQDKQLDLAFNFLYYFKYDEPLDEMELTYKSKNKFIHIDSDFDWNKNVIWYGRRKQIYKNSLDEINIYL